MISKEAIEAFMTKHKPANANGKGHATGGHGIAESADTLRAYLEEHGIVVKSIKADPDRTILILDGCPMNPDHGKGTDTAITLRADGSIGFACQHHGCASTTWPEVRRKIDPAYGTTPATPPSITSTASMTTNSWEPPAPLAEFDLPPFPVEAIPSDLSILSQYCEAVAESFQVPVDLPVMLALAGAGAALAKRIEVHVRGNHYEPVNLFTAIAMEPANRKTGVFSEISRPLSDYERELVEKMAPEIERSRTERAILEARLKDAQNRTAKTREGSERADAMREAQDLAEQLRQTPVLISPRLLADDATPEKLASLLHNHGGRIALLSPEGDTFDLMAGRYGTGGPNLGVYLKGHAGDDLRVDRVNRPAEFIHKPALTIGLAVQPAVLRGLIERPGFRGKGLLARFLYSIPKSTLGRRKMAPAPVPQDLTAQYHALMLAALRLEPITDDAGRPGPRIVRVGEEALKQLVDFAEKIEPKLASGGEYGGMADWAGKLTGAVARVAGIYHALAYARTGRPEEYPIAAETVLCAIALAEYLIPHARAAFAEMGSDPEIELARRILEWLKLDHGSGSRDEKRTARSVQPRSATSTAPSAFWRTTGTSENWSRSVKRRAGNPQRHTRSILQPTNRTATTDRSSPVAGVLSVMSIVSGDLKHAGLSVQRPRKAPPAAGRPTD